VKHPPFVPRNRLFPRHSLYRADFGGEAATIFPNWRLAQRRALDSEASRGFWCLCHSTDNTCQIGFVSVLHGIVMGCWLQREEDNRGAVMGCSFHTCDASYVFFDAVTAQPSRAKLSRSPTTPIVLFSVLYSTRSVQKPVPHSFAPHNSTSASSSRQSRSSTPSHTSSPSPHETPAPHPHTPPGKHPPNQSRNPYPRESRGARRRSAPPAPRASTRRS
jgi:hypothetical protein